MQKDYNPALRRIARDAANRPSEQNYADSQCGDEPMHRLRNGIVNYGANIRIQFKM